MIQASISTGFSECTSGPESDKHRPVFRGRKSHSRSYSGISPRYQPQRTLEKPRMAYGIEAFQEMILGSRTKFVAIAQAILRNREDAEDAVQDAFVSGLLHLGSFEGRSALTTWFTRIVLNAALMIRRKRKSAWMNSQPEIHNSDDVGWKEKIAIAQPNPEMIYAERETFQVGNQLLSKLKPALRQAFTLTYYDEMSRSEACSFLGVSPGAFKSRLFRARRLLKQAQRTRVASIRKE